MPTAFRPLEEFLPANRAYELLPFRHTTIPGVPDQVLVTSVVGEYAYVSSDDFRRLTSGELDPRSDVYFALRTRQIICDADRGPFIDGLEAQQRTRKLLAAEDPALHIFVVTLRCDHRCHYCQVTPRLASESGFDMSEETAGAAIDRVFESRSKNLTIEFQGGESSLAFDRVRYIVEHAERLKPSDRNLRFVLTTTTHLLGERELIFCRDHKIEISTSLDGPECVHNASRINSSRDAYARTIAGIKRARAICGPDHVAALATITRHSLPYPREIIDTYVELGFNSISLRPLSPFGFAVKGQRTLGYSMAEFLSFYREALDYLVQLNCRGTQIEESYASMLLTRILTPFPTSYVDLQSPAAAGTGVLVYNYDGGVYVSDEGRMLAAMGDDRFRMGSVHDDLRTLQRSQAMEIVRAGADAEAIPGCSTCAFVPYCGADPVFHVATQQNPIGDRATSDFCGRHMGQFRLLFEHLAKRDPETMRVFLAWISRRSADAITHPGYQA